jgi:hypothetical protein
MVLLVNDSEYSKSAGAKPDGTQGCFELVVPCKLLGGIQKKVGIFKQQPKCGFGAFELH